MLDDNLLARYMDRFFGYGNLNAPTWFVGMEEGGGKHIEEIAARLNVWHQRGERQVDDVADFHHAFGQPRWFAQDAPTQSTWRQLIRTALLADATRPTPVTLDAIRQYQIDEFARSAGAAASLELLPLPSTSTQAKDWKYSGWSAIQTLTTRDTYRQHYLPSRIAGLQALIAQYQPRAVVFYGSTYQAYWEAISGKTFGQGIFPRVQHGEETHFFVVGHPTSRPNSNQPNGPGEGFESVGLLLREANIL